MPSSVTMPGTWYPPFNSCISYKGLVISELRALYSKNSTERFQPTSLEVCPAHQFRNDENLKLFQFI